MSWIAAAVRRPPRAQPFWCRGSATPATLCEPTADRETTPCASLCCPVLCCAVLCRAVPCCAVLS
eukprot:7642419-Pyramimonas_sp.AAC.1